MVAGVTVGVGPVGALALEIAAVTLEQVCHMVTPHEKRLKRSSQLSDMTVHGTSRGVSIECTSGEKRGTRGRSSIFGVSRPPVSFGFASDAATVVLAHLTLP